jgi:dihydroorotate dehydrogenase
MEALYKMNIKYFYSAAVMEYGFGRPWHKNYKFPDFPRVTQTLTSSPRKGNPRAVIPLGRSVWNRVALDNIGFHEWFNQYNSRDLSNITLSLAGTYYQLCQMIHDINYGLTINKSRSIAGIEINLSCPNIKPYKMAPESLSYLTHEVARHDDYPIYLKLRYDQDPYHYDLTNVAGIRLNSVPFMGGGISGKMSQKKNWSFIERYASTLNVAGCSFTNEKDIETLISMGCTEIGIGSIILTNPRLVEQLYNID